MPHTLLRHYWRCWLLGAGGSFFFQVFLLVYFSCSSGRPHSHAHMGNINWTYEFLVGHGKWMCWDMGELEEVYTISLYTCIWFSRIKKTIIKNFPFSLLPPQRTLNERLVYCNDYPWPLSSSCPLPHSSSWRTKTLVFYCCSYMKLNTWFYNRR